MADLHLDRLEKATERLGVEPWLLAESIERLADRWAAAPTVGGLTATEVAFLDQHSGTKPNDSALLDAQIATVVSERDEEVHALTTEQVAHLLGKRTAGRVRQMVGEGRLYTLPSSRGRGTTLLFPVWQFHNDKPIPHVGTIADALGSDAHPLTVRAFFTNGQVEDGDTVMSVTDWLRSGGDVAPVLAMVAAEAYGL